MNRFLMSGLAVALAVATIGCGRFRHEVDRNTQGDIVSEKTGYLAFFQKVSADDYQTTVKDGNYERTVGVTGAETSGDAQMFLAGQMAAQQATANAFNMVGRFGGLPTIPGANQSVQWFQPNAVPLVESQPNAPPAAIANGQSGIIVTNSAGARFLLLDPSGNNSPPAIGAVGGDGPGTPRGEPPSPPVDTGEPPPAPPE